MRVQDETSLPRSLVMGFGDHGARRPCEIRDGVLVFVELKSPRLHVGERGRAIRGGAIYVRRKTGKSSSSGFNVSACLLAFSQTLCYTRRVEQTRSHGLGDDWLHRRGRSRWLGGTQHYMDLPGVFWSETVYYSMPGRTSERDYALCACASSSSGKWSHG